MALPAINPTTTNAWKLLQQHFNDVQHTEIKSLFAEDPQRATTFTILWNDFVVDYSKHRISSETMQLLLQLTDQCGLSSAIQAYFSGEVINQTEGRAVLHTALRADPRDTILVDGRDIMKDIAEVKEKMKTFSDAVISGELRGYSGKAFTDIVNIGIGGSDLGPVMVTEALQFYKNHLQLHYISNVDGDHVYETLKRLNPETTLFVVVSKTFTTQETLSNAITIKNWFLRYTTEVEVSKHFVAVSTNLEKITEFGISDNNVFPMWDWVGGRFSLWSAVGLSISLGVGFDNFEKLLEGAHAMDVHFKTTPPSENIPVILALLSVWYNNFYGAESQVVIPYTQYLHRFSAYLQQGIMESNGKSIDRNGERVSYETGNLIWGEPGTNSQHAFFS